MKSELLRQFRNLFQEKKVRLNKRLLIFFFFLLVSSFIWLLNTLDKEYITELNFPVDYENFPVNQIQTKDLPEFFSLRIEASGYLLLKLKIGKSLYPLQINVLNYLSETLLNDTNSFTINTANFLDEIENQLNKQIKVIDIKPETLEFLFEKKVSKEVPIHPDFKYTFEKQLIFKGQPKIKPEKIYVSGPSNIIDTLSFVSSIEKDLGLISSNLMSTIQLKPIKNTLFSINEASVFVEVEKFTESSLQVPVVVNNLPDSVSIQLIPDVVTLNYCTGLSSYNNIKPSQFILLVDFKEYIDKKSSKFTVLVKNSPKEVFNIKISPRTIKYIIKNKNL